MRIKGCFGSLSSKELSLKLAKGEKREFTLEFLEWFRGFTDAEGSFGFIYVCGARSEKNYYQFTFQINLHVDDVGALSYIRDTLGFGLVKISKTLPVTSFIVRSLDDVKVIISLFLI